MSPVAQPWKSAEENSWWSATGKTAASVAFTNALTLALPGGKFAVMTSPGVMESVPATSITAAVRMAVVDAEWISRSQSQATDINTAQRRLSEVESVCQGWLSRAQPHSPDVSSLIDAITDIVAEKAEVGR